MQATLDAFSLKAFTKALNCLSKYGDELSIHATPEYLSFSATNSSKSAFCLFKYEKRFFSRYKLSYATDGKANEFEEEQSVTGQLTVKAILTILKHRTVEKAVERCELAIVEGNQADNIEEEDEEDSLESRLIIRFYCKHGVIKTHRLVLLIPGSIMTPGVPDPANESRLIIGPKALKDLLDHFPVSKGARSDPQLVWTFEESDVNLKSIESSIDSRGKGQLSTEISISSDEFDVYDVFQTPTSLAFHLREFNATLAFADSLSLPLEMRFTEPTIPLFIEMEGDALEILFVISTSQVQGAPSATQRTNSQAINCRKRDREQSTSETPRMKKPMKAAQAMALDRESSVGNARAGSHAFASMPPPLAIPYRQASEGVVNRRYDSGHTNLPASNRPDQWSSIPRKVDNEPLFLPSSQMSLTDEEALKAIGLDADAMDADQLIDLLEGDGEEVDFSYMSHPPSAYDMQNHDATEDTMEVDGPENFRLVDEAELTATQLSEDPNKARLIKAWLYIFMTN